MPRLFARVHATAYVTGNILPEASQQLAADVAAALESGASSRPPWSGQAPLRRVVKLPAGRDVTFCEPAPSPTNVNSAVAISFQVGVLVVFYPEHNLRC